MEAFSMDLRQRVWDAVNRRHETGETIEAIAKRFQVSEPWIYKLQRRFAAEQTLEPMPHGGGQPLKVTEELAQRLCDKIREQPDATLAELRDHLGIRGSIMAVFRALKRLGVSRKKKRSTPRNEKIPT
jgi:transposase